MEPPKLYLFSGLPGSGKTTLSRRLAAESKAIHLRIDTIEQALRDLCDVEVGGEGYRLAYRVAADNLDLGLSVVADSCNPIELTRREWEAVAKARSVEYINIEVICSDEHEHRRRVQSRPNSVPNLVLPTWEEVEAREYHPWTSPRITIDTARVSPEMSYQKLQHALSDR